MSRIRYCCGPMYVCPYCKEVDKTQAWLTDVLITKEYERRVARSIDYACCKDTLRQKQSQQEQRARQFRLEQLFSQAQESKQEQRMLQQRQQEE